MAYKKKIFLYIAALFFFINFRCIGGSLDSVKITQYKTPNQMNIILIHTPPSEFQTASVILTVKAGSLTEGKFLGKGISHFLEHLLFKGTEDKSDTALARRVKALGGYINAHTGFTQTQYYINLPSRHIDKALNILSEMILHADFSDEEFKTEKDVILREMDMNNDNPSRYLSEKFFSLNYFDTPMQYPIIGLKDDFYRLTIKDIKEYYEDLYQPANMILTVCGDFNEQKLKQTIQKLFGGVQNKNYTSQNFSAIKRRTGKRIKSFTMPNLYTTKVIVGFKSCTINDNDLYSLDIASEILAGGSSSRLQSILLNKNIVNSVSSYNYTPQFEGVFTIEFEAPPSENPEKIIELINGEINALKQGKAHPDEIQRAIKRVSLDYATGMEKNSEKAFRYTNSFSMTGTFDFPETYIHNLHKVTAQDIAQAAKKYLTEENMTIAILSPLKSVDKDKNHNKKIHLPQEPELFTLKNGIRVILKNNEHTSATHIVVYLKGGAAFENKAQEGISYLTSRMLLKGTNNLTRQELAEKIEMKGGSCSPVSGYNLIGLNYTVLNENIEDAFNPERYTY